MQLFQMFDSPFADIECGIDCKQTIVGTQRETTQTEICMHRIWIRNKDNNLNVTVITVMWLIAQTWNAIGIFGEPSSGNVLSGH